MLSYSDRSNTNVLILDNNEKLLRELQQKLMGDSYAVSTATRPEEALDIAREIPFDVVLCGINSQYSTGGMNGIQFSKALQRMHPQIPVVVMSDEESEIESKSFEAGASDFVVLPSEKPELPDILERAIKHKHYRQQKLSEERSVVLFKAIKAITSAVDAKSLFTDHHSLKVADLSMRIGHELQLSPSELNILELSAHIHDIGKIGTPEDVLGKPARLSEDEWVDVLKHPSIGSDFFQGVDELSEVASIIRHHHERMDGKGYPDGLKGEAIPFLARLLAVADAFEAMTSERPYRQARTLSSAVNELIANSGTQFDPRVVQAAANVLDMGYEEVQEKAA